MIKRKKKKISDEILSLMIYSYHYSLISPLEPQKLQQQLSENIHKSHSQSKALNTNLTFSEVKTSDAFPSTGPSSSSKSPNPRPDPAVSSASFASSFLHLQWPPWPHCHWLGPLLLHAASLSACSDRPRWEEDSEPSSSAGLLPHSSVPDCRAD